MAFEKIVVKGIANWAHLIEPEENLDGKKQWSLTLTVPKSVSDEWIAKKYQKTAKVDKDGNSVLKLRKPCLTAAGKELKHPPVQHPDRYLITEDIVGNGSLVTVQVVLIPYDGKFGKGISARLDKVKVNELVEYKGDDDGFFDDIVDAPATDDDFMEDDE